ADRKDEARAIGSDVLERQRRALGPEDPDTLVTRMELGQLLFPFGDPRAREYYRSLHEALARALGPERVETGHARHVYAMTFQDRGDSGRAAEILREALELRIRGAGEVADATFWTANDLAYFLTSARAYDRAWAVVERFWPIECRTLDPGNT